MQLKNELPSPKVRIFQVNCGESFAFKDNQTEPMMKVSINLLGCMLAQNECSYVSLRNGYVKKCDESTEVCNVGMYHLDT